MFYASVAIYANTSFVLSYMLVAFGANASHEYENKQVISAWPIL